jgi:enoyl-CoA hydratase/carnithine racemase
MNTESPVLFRRSDNGAVGIATLNRPRQLNALTLEMCESMGRQFGEWANDDSIKCVLLDANGDKGFCAGGDVAEVIRQVRAGGEQRYEYGDAFFATEYALNLMMHTYSKPLIVLSHGVCMGGGVGLLAGASHGVLVAGSKIAMPEIHIGLFPDVGGGYFLQDFFDGRDKLMALTGCVINEGDALEGYLASFVIPASARDGFVDAITAIEWADSREENDELISECIEEMDDGSVELTGPFATFSEETKKLNRCESVNEFRDALNELAKREPYFAGAAKNLSQGSPTAAHVTFEYLKRCRSLEIDEVLALDLVLAKQFQRHHDFSEGVRALLIDKDKSPRWSPADWHAVDRALIDAHFASIVK